MNNVKIIYMEGLCANVNITFGVGNREQQHYPYLKIPLTLVF